MVNRSARECVAESKSISRAGRSFRRTEVIKAFGGAAKGFDHFRSAERPAGSRYGFRFRDAFPGAAVHHAVVSAADGQVPLPCGKRLQPVGLLANAGGAFRRTTAGLLQIRGSGGSRARRVEPSGAAAVSHSSTLVPFGAG